MAAQPTIEDRIARQRQNIAVDLQRLSDSINATEEDVTSRIVQLRRRLPFVAVILGLGFIAGLSFGLIIAS